MILETVLTDSGRSHMQSRSLTSESQHRAFAAQTKHTTRTGTRVGLLSFFFWISRLSRRSLVGCAKLFDVSAVEDQQTTDDMKQFQANANKKENKELWRTPFHGRRKDFFRGGWPKVFFQGGATVVKSQFTNSKTKRKTLFYWKVTSEISKFKIQRGPSPRFPTPMNRSTVYLSTSPNTTSKVPEKSTKFLYCIWSRPATQ